MNLLNICRLALILLIVRSIDDVVIGLREVKQVDGDVLWVVQLSDLHFSVHHPDRAQHFKKILGNVLGAVNPALVLITGDLTDGKSKDLLTMKQIEKEWMEYQKTLADTITMSGLPKENFYDLHGNHDKFGVSVPNGHFDYFARYSMSALLNRTGKLKSITLQSSGRKHLFVGLDTSMEIGLRGPTNLFGHPTDEQVAELDKELSVWDSEGTGPTTKIVFGHFPLSFTASTKKGYNLIDIFAKHRIAAYLCGHLHTSFGKNLQKHYFQVPKHLESLKQYFQFEAHYMMDNNNIRQCHGLDNGPVKEFWEWEMGDWRKNRMLRIIAIDEGHTSFIDFDLRNMGWTLDAPAEIIQTFVVPTFPLDSRTMHTTFSSQSCQCSINSSSCYEPIRALIFSLKTISSVKGKIYDSISGDFHLVTELELTKYSGRSSQENLYVSEWDWQRFDDPSPDRFWLQIEAIEDSGKAVYGPRRPFSVNMKAAPLKWSWKEFMVMGCQWDLLYMPFLWFMYILLLAMLLLPKLIDCCTRNDNHVSRSLSSFKIFSCFFFKIPVCSMIEASKNHVIWWSELIYVVSLIIFPWFYGQALEEDSGTSFMSHKGWTVNLPNSQHSYSGIGVPDVMVIVLPHLYFVVFPIVCVLTIFAAEKAAFERHISLKARKKEFEDSEETKEKLAMQFASHCIRDCTGSCVLCGRWIRKALFGFCLLILWSHLKRCNALVHAYGARGVFGFPGFAWPVILLLALAVWNTR